MKLLGNHEEGGGLISYPSVTMRYLEVDNSCFLMLSTR